MSCTIVHINKFIFLFVKLNKINSENSLKLLVRRYIWKVNVNITLKQILNINMLIFLSFIKSFLGCQPL